MSHLWSIFSFQRRKWPDTQANLYVSLRLQTAPLKKKKNHQKTQLEIWLFSWYEMKHETSFMGSGCFEQTYLITRESKLLH